MFRLNSLTLKKHKVLKDLTIDFNHEGMVSDQFFLSVIMGKNGIGKSQILKAICEIFIYLCKLNNDSLTASEPSFDFLISYEIDGKHIEVSRESVRRGERITSENLPTRLIATSTFVMDKYPTQSNLMYRYCGIRNEYNSGSTSTKGLIRKTVQWILKSLSNKIGFVDEIKSLLHELGLREQLTLSYSVRYRDVFLRGNLTTDHLKGIYTHQDVYFPHRRHEIWGTDGFKSICNDEDSLNVIVSFLNGLSGVGRTFQNIHGSNKIYIELLNYWNPADINEIARAIDLCGKIGILSYPTLTTYKRQDAYDFSESSSGETTLLCQLLSIMSNIEPNSLILIDEPEQSCHPNWQINYVTWLRRIFQYYSTCHFIVSTHSHFLLTDLNPDNSSLTVLDFTRTGGISVNNWSQMPYGWSSDDILYRVFHVRNTRNFVFESRMMRLYDLIQDSQDHKEEINELIEELKEYQLNDDDPLNKLFEYARSHA